MWLAKRLATSFVLKGHGLFFNTSRSLPEYELRLLHCTCCRRSGIMVAGFNTVNGSDSSEFCQEDGKPLDSCYTAEQRAVILQRLNTATESELAQVKMLRGRKAVNILSYRSRHGPFDSLESVINVPLLKHKSAVVVFNSILKSDDMKDRRKGKIHLAKFIRPEVDRALLKEASSIISIVFGTNKIAWAHMDRAKTVLDWQQEECKSFMNGTYMASDYLKDISAVISKFPAADFFVVEKPSISPQNTSLFPVMAHLRTVEAMLFALLTPVREPGRSPKVLNMMRTAVGRHFDLMVGDSRASGAETVRKMMTESVMKQEPRVVFPHNLVVKHRNSFQMSSKNRGEELCDTLLQAVAFFELLRE
ncbi:transcription elongation factor, mitochondrial isoform X1 [Triplophysa rosa]|uniref:Transcription elongation factor, mitochondrial n=2 Tax=Triplophysa rosa TaxID=992332 RepID=A0A9W8C475_TRIRA|nr:transcription elongation factor, mitochondrial isoform X1 [Triplophysa rosa]KAI7807311.1 Transcription elongation factor [Triplophysa rosa]